uniref:MFS domain-containing protein n=1 Tax=Syphacia muris TaxID=451379 RepID=A0A0N5AVH7_9BILA
SEKKKVANFLIFTFRSYRSRWIVLCAVALLNFSNTFLWIVFAAVANHVNFFYGYAANWFSLIFILCTIPVGFLAMWLGSKFGLRTTLLIAAWLNAGGTLFRFLSSFVPPSIRFPVGIVGQGISACAYPFIMFLPTKVAGSWFPDNERTLATTVGVMANPFGVFMANILSPRIVASPNDRMNCKWILCRVCKFSCFSNKSFIVLSIALGGGIGMFNCLYTVIQQLLCPVGYTNTFSGFCASTMIVGGVIGAFAAGVFVDKTKAFEATLKVSFALAVLFGLAFLQLTLHVGLHPMVVLCCFLFGIFGLAAYPVGLQISAECTFPVPENVSTGLIVLAGQVQSFLYVALVGFSARELPFYLIPIQKCTASESESPLSSAKDNTYSVIVSSYNYYFAILVLRFSQFAC